MKKKVQFDIIDVIRLNLADFARNLLNINKLPPTPPQPVDLQRVICSAKQGSFLEDQNMQTQYNTVYKR
ncbi:hypothetical protein FACS1894178_3740 [Bacteroidia bacterium]|nr:hypothetical protein FACS1894178_3740 [Bacteroidia bacterium]